MQRGKNVLGGSCVGLSEKMSLQPISELFMANGGGARVCRQRVPDSGSCEVETPPAELSPGPNQHDIQPNRDVPDQDVRQSETGVQTSSK